MVFSRDTKRAAILLGCFLGLFIVHIITGVITAIIRAHSKRLNGSPDSIKVVLYRSPFVNYSHIVYDRTVHLHNQTSQHGESHNMANRPKYKGRTNQGEIDSVQGLGDFSQPSQGQQKLLGHGNPKHENSGHIILDSHASIGIENGNNGHTILDQNTEQHDKVKQTSAEVKKVKYSDVEISKDNAQPSESELAMEMDYFHYIGGMLAPLPAGYIALHFSGSFVFGGLVLMACMLNLLATIGLQYTSVSLLRVVSYSQGVVESSLAPVIFSLLITWTTERHMTSQVAMVMSASYLGDLVGDVIGCYLVQSHSYGVHGLTVVGLCILFYWILVVNLRVHRNFRAVNVLPVSHIGAGLGNDLPDQRREFEPSFGQVPWSAMFRSAPLAALMYSSFVFFLLYYSSPLVTTLLGYAAFQSQFVWLLPQAIVVVTGVLSGILVVTLRRDSGLTATQIRRIMVCGGLGLEAGFLVWISLSYSRQLTLIFLTIGIGFSGWTLTSLQVNAFDLAPRCASVVGAMNSAATYTAGLTATTIFKHADSSDADYRNWLQPIFVTLSVLVSSAALLYGVIGSGERQLWDLRNTRGKIRVAFPDSALTGSTDVGFIKSGTTVIKQQTEYDYLDL